MKGRIVKGLAALLAGTGAAVAVAAGGAGGPTTVGDAGFHINSSAYDDAVFVQAVDSTRSPTYSVPPGGGVITSWSVQFYDTSLAGDIQLKLFQPLGGDSYKLVGEDTGHVLAGDQFRTYPARIPVAGGVRLGIRAPNSSTSIGTDFDSSGSDPGDIRIKTGNPAVGDTITMGEFAFNSRLALSAVVEPDADQDGFGDTSQDACPADPARHDAPCVTALASSLKASGTTVAQGDLVTLTGSVRPSLGTSAGTLGNMLLPAGLQPIFTASSGSDCAINVLVSCPLGDLAPGTTGTMVVAARAVGHGDQVVTMAGSSGTQLASADTSTATITITDAPASTDCVVPPLKGLTRKAAGTLLKAFRCGLGKVTKKRKPRHGALRVSAQKPKAGTRAPAGAKVSITLRRRR